ncbi:MAG: HD domain-containing protein [Armatimonadota bacterium]|jgi:tRNA nucleotidyltransferase/poly(A) polymerase
MSPRSDKSQIAEAVEQALRRDPCVAEVADLAEEAGLHVFVVGGFIRDVILGRPSPDVDFVVPGAADFARDFSGRVRGTYVLLHEDHETARVAVRKRMYDFADVRGESIAEDLARRDFALNAIAYDLDATALVDPLGGMEDIDSGIVRVASDRALQDDPVRIVRAFRFAAELGFEIQEGTAALIADAAARLADAAGERVRAELLSMLTVPRAAPFVRQMDELGVLAALLPQLAETKGVTQDDRHHLDVWEHTLATFEQVEEILCHVEHYFPAHTREMQRYLARGETVGVLKLAALLHDVAKPAVMQVDDEGRPAFAGHSAEGARMAGRAADRLRLSRRDRQALVGLVRHHRRPMELIEVAARGKLRPRTMARYFRTTGHHSVGLLLLALAHGRAMLGPAQAPDWQAAVTELVSRLLDFYFDEYVPKEKLPRLLTGRDLLDEFSLSPGPELGEMLEALQDAQMADQVRTKQEALEFVRERLREQRKSKGGAS